MLRREDEVSQETDWQEFEEPPLQTSEAETNEDEAEEKPAPLVLKDGKSGMVALPRTDVSELTAKIAALETAIARTADQWEPDGAGRDAYAGTQAPAMVWQDDVELDPRGKPLGLAPTDRDAGSRRAPGETSRLETAEAALDAAVEDQIVDEETLRVIVSEIVRSELQGALGERITRNVRKLVRREIHRVLVSQSLE